MGSWALGRLQGLLSLMDYGAVGRLQGIRWVVGLGGVTEPWVGYGTQDLGWIAGIWASFGLQVLVDYGAISGVGYRASGGLWGCGSWVGYWA